MCVPTAKLIRKFEQELGRLRFSEINPFTQGMTHGMRLAIALTIETTEDHRAKRFNQNHMGMLVKERE